MFMHRYEQQEKPMPSCMKVNKELHAVNHLRFYDFSLSPEHTLVRAHMHIMMCMYAHTHTCTHTLSHPLIFYYRTLAFSKTLNKS